MFCFGIFIHLNTVSRKKAEDVTKKSPQPLDDRFYRFNGLRLGVYMYAPTIPGLRTNVLVRGYSLLALSGLLIYNIPMSLNKMNVCM